MGEEKREARATWLQQRGAALSAEWPARMGLCPMCGADAAFNRHPHNPSKWVCHSTTHNSIQAGRQKGDVWWGDALDLESHLRGISDTDVLRQDGYLEDRPVTAEDRRKWAKQLAAREAAEKARKAKGWRKVEALQRRMKSADGWAGRTWNVEAPLQITVFRPDLAGRRPTHQTNPGEAKETTWRGLSRTFQEPRDVPEVPPGCDVRYSTPKHWVTGWCASRFHGDRRGAKTVIDSGALLIDLDSDPTKEGAKRGAPDLDPQRLSTMVAKVVPGVAFLAHTTPSSRNGAWRWRLVLPLARRVTADEYGRLSGAVRLSARFCRWSAPFEADSSWVTPTRFFYAPTRFPDYRFTVEPGSYLEPDRVLRMLHV
jgi:hypothetical protein